MSLHSHCMMVPTSLCVLRIVQSWSSLALFTSPTPRLRTCFNCSSYSALLIANYHPACTSWSNSAIGSVPTTTKLKFVLVVVKNCLMSIAVPRERKQNVSIHLPITSSLQAFMQSRYIIHVHEYVYICILISIYVSMWFIIIYRKLGQALLSRNTKEYHVIEWYSRWSRVQKKGAQAWNSPLQSKVYWPHFLRWWCTTVKVIWSSTMANLPSHFQSSTSSQDAKRKPYTQWSVGCSGKTKNEAALEPHDHHVEETRKGSGYQHSYWCEECEWDTALCHFWHAC